jgi:tRNA 2-thiocytidine biosynthesis protein TtcA
MQFPIIPCNLCGSQDNLARKIVAKLITDLARQNPKIPSNILNAISNIKPSHMMDRKLWDFTQLNCLDLPQME